MLELRNITYEVEDNQDNKEILKDVSLTIDEHFVAITGPNGGGKSTLAKIIAGIIKPTSGQIILDGEDITELDITERAKHGISYAFQQPVHFKGLTVKDLITIAAGRTMTVNEICEILSAIAWATRPLTPVSTSSKMILVTPCSEEKIVFNANNIRDSSPPEATFTNGFNGSPGFVVM